MQLAKAWIERLKAIQHGKSLVDPPQMAQTDRGQKQEIAILREAFERLGGASYDLLVPALLLPFL
jgi:hypothetical protein